MLDVTLVRSMLNTADTGPPTPRPSSLLRRRCPQYADRGVTLALETYEQVPTADLVGSSSGRLAEHLGICLDPANCVAGSSYPPTSSRAPLRYVKNMHVKDFAFARQAGWVGFTFAGCPLGAACSTTPPVEPRPPRGAASTRSSSTGCPGRATPRPPAHWKRNGRNTISTI